MISSVSNVNFRGDAAPVNAQDLINSPGKYTTQAPKAEAPADSFEKEGAAEEKKKSKAPAIIGTVVGLLAAVYVGLSIAVGKKALTKAVAEEGKELGFMGNVKNFFVSIGESGEKLWNKIRGKKAEDVDVKPKTETPEPKKGNTTETAKNEGAEAPKNKENTETPKKEEGTEGVKKEENAETPKKEEGAEGVKKEENAEAPKKEEGAEGAKKEENAEAPKKEENAEGAKKEEPKKEEEKK